MLITIWLQYLLTNIPSCFINKPSARTLCMTHGEKQITGLPGHIDSLACCHSSTGDCTTSDNDHVASVKQPVAPDPLTVSSMSKGFFSPSHEHSSSSVLPLLIDGKRYVLSNSVQIHL